MIALQLLGACLVIGVIGGLLAALESDPSSDWRQFFEKWAVFAAVLALYAAAAIIVILCVIFIAAGIVTVTGYSG